MFWIKSLHYNKLLLINLIIISFKFTSIYSIISLYIDVSFCLSVCLYLPLLSFKLTVLFSNFTLAKFYVIYTWHWLELCCIWKYKLWILENWKIKTFFNFHVYFFPKWIQLLFVDIKKRFLRMFGVLFHKYNALYTFLNFIVKIALNVLISSKHRVFVGCLCC